jgi:hypothetical protein
LWCCNIKIFFVTLQLRLKMGYPFVAKTLWEVLFVDSSACMEGSGATFN